MKRIYTAVTAIALVVQAVAGDPEVRVSTQDWGVPVFPWQSFDPETALQGPLTIVASPGEYEPVTFNLHATQEIPKVTAVATALKGSAGKLLPPDCFTVFQVKPLKRESLNEAAFINRLPNIPEAWKSISPELLVPLTDEAPDLKPGRGQRFYVDCRIPPDQAPGVYQGRVVLQSEGRPLLSLPLRVRVLPIDLAPAPCRYWMWRLTWSPIDEPGNLACLRDIKAHGYTGLTRMCGAGLSFRFVDGQLEVDDSGYAAFAAACRQTGLAREVADTGVAGALLGAIAKHLDLPIRNVAEDLPQLEDHIYAKLHREHMKQQAADNLKNLDAGDLTDVDIAGVDELMKDDDAVPIEKQLREQARREAAAAQKRVAALAVDGFRKVKAAAEKHGLTVRVFPVDEPCGTPWRRAWTRYAAGLARQAGLETWSTRNNWDWDANLDHGAAGAMINAMYRPPTPASHKFAGTLKIPASLWIGAFRDGANYHFQGLIDDVRIYSRALTSEEIQRQHAQPVGDDLAVHLACDGADMPAKLVGNPEFVDGKIGRAVELNGRDQRLTLALREKLRDPTQGWSISLWYKGSGCLFGHGYDFYHQGGGLRYSTSEEDKAWFRYGGHQSPRFWTHLTVSFDPETNTITAFCNDAELRRWHRNKVRWNYVQVRSFPPRNPRFKTGIMAWWYANHGALTNITTFGYDWNTTHLYVVYPKNGERFDNDGVWYRTLGWEACREGIDDARYLETLRQALQKRRGLSAEKAVTVIRRLLAPVDGSYHSIGRVPQHFGSYQGFRRTIIEHILKTQGDPTP